MKQLIPLFMFVSGFAAGVAVISFWPTNPYPLHTASATGDLLTVRELLASGYKIWSRDTDGLTPLHWAVNEGKFETASALLGYRAALEGIVINAPDSVGNTPLHYAVGNRDVEMVQLLISKSANVNARTIHGQSVLFWTTGQGSEHDTKMANIAALLISAGGDPTVPTNKGMTPTVNAQSLGSLHLVRVLSSQ